jgi:hypothetical protein
MAPEAAGKSGLVVEMARDAEMFEIDAEVRDRIRRA